MSGEFIVVEEPASHRGRRSRLRARERPTRRQVRRRAAVVAGAALLVGALVLSDRAAGGAGDAASAVTPTPSATLASATSAQQATAIAYTEYRARVELAACLNGIGDPYEPRVTRHEPLVADVAAYLGIDPAPIDAAAPSPELRHPRYYLDSVPAPPRSPACPAPNTEMSASDAAEIAATVRQAVADDGFRAAIAEQEWLRRHPAEASHFFALLGADGAEAPRSDPAASERWEVSLAEVTESLADVVWIPVTQEATDMFAQASGLTESGSAIVVRVSGEPWALVQGGYMTTVIAIECDGAVVSVGARRPWGNAQEALAVATAVAAACVATAPDVA
ncbi:hypothetical protein [Demequina sp. NBRC 110057]|uniref:hypothetical protein n=1 Tax=Demequina sp. NBRC 110057 TaxID=1570346 RepID=UPI0009FD49B8|nr:hypothetical protein [Demequina sp. NBRC 110057]